MKKKPCLVIVVLVLACLLMPLVEGDAPNPQKPDYLDIQYAKVVSEGGYFWLNITLKTELLSLNYVEIRLTYDSMFRCTNYQEYFKLDNHNQTVFFLFITAFIFAPLDTAYIHIESALNGLATHKSIDITECPVVAVDLELFTIAKESLYNATYGELLRKYMILQQNYTNLSTEYRGLQDLMNLWKGELDYYRDQPYFPVGMGGWVPSSGPPLEMIFWEAILVVIIIIGGIFLVIHRNQPKESTA